MLSGTAEVQVRPGVEDDVKALTALYNHYVRETPITFDTEPFTPEERRPWLLSTRKTARTS
ncbi:N-acetyltransferase OS=Streptomyces tendae OX=1932 GN=GUR47_27290 PE=4 SV=1 [Streptomyces tendae]